MESFKDTLIKNIKNRYNVEMAIMSELEAATNLITGYFNSIKRHIKKEIELSDGNISLDPNEDEIVRFIFDSNYIAFVKNKDCIEVIISDVVNNPYDVIVIKKSIQGKYLSYSKKMNKELDNNVLDDYLRRAFELFL